MLAMAALLGAGLTASFAHLDDPKEQDRVPRFEGPAYRADATFAADSAMSSRGALKLVRHGGTF